MEQDERSPGANAPTGAILLKEADAPQPPPTDGGGDGQEEELPVQDGDTPDLDPDEELMGDVDADEGDDQPEESQGRKKGPSGTLFADSGDDDLPVIDDMRLKSIVESLIFVSGKIITLDRIMGVLGEDIPRATVSAALSELVEEYRHSNRGFALMEVSGGYQFRSNPENADWIGRLFEAKPTRLSMAALEVLAIVAYRQPLTRLEVEELRGVDSSGVMKMLLQRKLIKVLGYKEEPGRPRIYGTSAGFLEFFNLKSIRDLPPLREYAELTDASRQRLETLISKGVKTKPAGQVPLADSYAAGSADPSESSD